MGRGRLWRKELVVDIDAGHGSVRLVGGRCGSSRGGGCCVQFVVVVVVVVWDGIEGGGGEPVSAVHEALDVRWLSEPLHRRPPLEDAL